jgi:hypothetical protein
MLRRIAFLFLLSVFLLLFPVESYADKPVADPRLKYARTVFVETMEEDLHAYIVAEFQKWGRLKVVLKKEDADVVMKGTASKGDDKWFHTVFGGKDKVQGSCFIVDRGEKEILWAAEAGDRSLLWGGIRRGGQRKVADRIINQLQESMKALGARDRPLPIPPGEDPFPRLAATTADTSSPAAGTSGNAEGGLASGAQSPVAQTAGNPLGAATAEPAPAAPAPTASEDLTTAVVKSDPGGADVTVDGKYMGSTPSTLRLAPGDHTILIEKPGHKAWQRTMTVNPGGIVTIDAALAKTD